MSTLNPDRWQQLSPYLDQALEMPSEERAAWLASLRAENPSLAALLQTLLDEHLTLAEEHFLEHSPITLAEPPALAGQSVGAYTLVSLIGQGGMGSVWLARRSDGRFERQAAVKFLNVGLVGRGGEERFKREGRILGRLAHPHIAELLDAGVSFTGQPYLVLEYVDGHHISDYCDRCSLGVEARIRLFLDVLTAVSHAHANLIVHRDIKPSNVLVTNDGQAKLVDFGIAKLLEEAGQSATPTLLTRESGAALTPEYAAPEQVTGAPVTTATDVYALGVLLYVLLTGQHPAGPEPLSTAKLVKAIVETEPEHPSDVVLRSDAEAKTLHVNAASRGTTPERLQRALRGDLDTILSKTLKKNSQERYASVTAFAADLGRYLRHEPITARPDTLAYRAAKFMRRNRAAVALTALAVAATVAGLTGTLVQARTARRQRDVAYRERDRAQRITDFMTGMFKVSDPSETAGNAVTAREILDKASKDIDTGLTRDPELQAQMMHAMGTVYDNLGLYDQAQSLLERAIQVSRGADGATNPEALRAMDYLGFILMQEGHPGEGEKLQRQALDVQRRTLGPEHPDTLGTMSDLSATLEEEGHLEEAITLCRDALEKKRRILGVTDHRTIAVMDNLAVMLGVNGQLVESEQLERETIELERRVYGPDHLGVLTSMGNQADALYLMGRYAEAKQLLRQTLDIQLRVLGPDHPETARSVYNLGCLAARAGRRNEAFLFLGRGIDRLTPRSVPKVENDPDLNSLHGDPRFQLLVDRAKRRSTGDARCPL